MERKNSARWPIKIHPYQLQEIQMSPYFINLTSQIQPVAISLDFFTCLFIVDMGSFFPLYKYYDYIFKVLMKFLYIKADLHSSSKSKISYFMNSNLLPFKGLKKKHLLSITISRHFINIVLLLLYG